MSKFANLEFTPLKKNLYSGQRNEVEPDPIMLTPTLQKNENIGNHKTHWWWPCGEGMCGIKFTERGQPHLVNGVAQTEHWIRQNGQWVNTEKSCPNCS